jgi:hypothetical protein
MRSITLATATLALTGLGVAPAVAQSTTAAQPSETERQRGVVLECRGAADGLSAYVDLYENDRHGNYFQVILDDDPDLAASRTPKDILDKGQVGAAIRIDGHKVRVTGTAHRVGKRKPVHEEVDDAGQHVVSDGFHRRLAHDLELTYRGTAVPLDCAPAFFYSLKVTSTDTTG